MNKQIIPVAPHAVGSVTIPTVNARELHKFLEVKKDFSDWIKDQIKRARLIENRDFVACPLKGVGGKFASVDYFLTLEAGKHVSMMSNTDKGFEVRDYFIECERLALIPTDPIILIRLDQISIQKQVKMLAAKIEDVALDRDILFNELDGVNKAVGRLQNHTTQLSLKIPTNPITMKIHVGGLTVGQWATKRGFKPTQVRNVISGLSTKQAILDALEEDGFLDNDLF